MIDTKRIEEDGIVYEIVTPETIARDLGYQVMVNDQTRERQAFLSWKYVDEQPPEGWKIVAHPVRSVEKPEPHLLEQLQALIDAHGQGESMYSAGTGKVPHFIPDDFIDIKGKGSFREYFCITARRNGEVVGVLSFATRDTASNVRQGMVDRGVVRQSERKTEAIDISSHISENLMRLAIATLVSEHHCAHIETEPISKQGERYALLNGFHKQRDARGGMRYILREEIIDGIRDYLQTYGKQKIPWSRMFELKDVIDHLIGEIMEGREGKMRREGRSEMVHMQ